MKPTLLVLAAGAGSRYGGLKQLDVVGPGGEAIMDYSVYDAVRAGFGKVVFVVRRHFREEFEEKIVSKYRNITDVVLVEQELDKLPEGFSLNPAREKPWGTGHAVLMAAEVIDTPFAVINADDFYGRHSFEVLADFLLKCREGEYSMVGFSLERTLSESGTVSRGICYVDSGNYLAGVEEHHNVKAEGEGIFGDGMDGVRHLLDNHAPTSMNMWGFTPDYFKYSEEIFIKFLKENMSNLKAEFFIPLIVNELIQTGRASVTVLDTPSKWFGVTYAQDRPDVVAKIADLIAKGEYPEKLF